MTSKEFIETIREFTDDTVADFRYSDERVRIIGNEAMNRIARKTYCVEKPEYSINSVTNTQEYALPTDFVKMRTVIFRYTDTAYPSTTSLKESGPEVTQRATGPGVPRWYTIWNNTLRLDKPSDRTVTNGIRLRYFGTASEIPTGTPQNIQQTDFPSNYHLTAAYMAAAIIYEMDSEREKAADLKSLVNENVQDIIEEIHSRSFDGASMTDGFDIESRLFSMG